MARPFLLDVNLLIALFDSAHVHHEVAHDWFGHNRGRGWRTCPITENGFLRILSNPAYPNGPLSVGDLATRLKDFQEEALDYDFWPDDFRFVEWIAHTGRLLPSTKLTDAYLVKLAVAHGGALATLDSGITSKLIGEEEAEIVERIH